MTLSGFHGVFLNHGMRGVHGKHGKDRCHGSSCLVMGFSLQLKFMEVSFPRLPCTPRIPRFRTQKNEHYTSVQNTFIKQYQPDNFYFFKPSPYIPFSLY